MSRFGLRVVAGAHTVSDLISSPSMRPVRCEDLLSFNRGFSMFKRTAATLVVSAALTASVAFSQTAPNPTQQTIAPSDGPVPIFRISVVGRTTPAINYRPRRGDTK